MYIMRQQAAVVLHDKVAGEYSAALTRGGWPLANKWPFHVVGARADSPAPHSLGWKLG